MTSKLDELRLKRVRLESVLKDEPMLPGMRMTKRYLAYLQELKLVKDELAKAEDKELLSGPRKKYPKS